MNQRRSIVVLHVGYHEHHGSIAKEGERMSLTIVTTNEERLAGNALKRLVNDGCQSGGVVVMVPSFAEVLEVQKGLADEGVGLGVEVCTPDSWARDRWDVWGDGRRVVDGSIRTLLAAECLREHAKGSEIELSQTPGTVRLLGSLAQRALPWLGEALRERGDRLTPAERYAVSLLGAYERLLRNRGFIEGVECACLLPDSLAQAGASPSCVVLAGFDDLSRATRELACGLAQIAEVALVVCTAKTLFCEQAKLAANRLRKDAESHGLEVTCAREEADKPAEAQEKPGHGQVEEDVRAHGERHEVPEGRLLAGDFRELHAPQVPGKEDLAHDEAEVAEGQQEPVGIVA